MPTESTSNKDLVRRMVDEAINDRRFELANELATERLAPKLQAAWAQFDAAFPDWHQEIIELVEEHDTVVARFRCTGTQATEWEGLPSSGKQMDVDEVAFIHFTGGRISHMWALEDTWTRIQQLAGRRAALGELGSLS